MQDAKEKMKRLLREQNMCVLATCSDNEPHCSLMAYVTDDPVSTVYMVTLKESRKFRNLMENPQASLLVDTRVGSDPLERAGIQALTVYGSFQALKSKLEREQVMRRLAQVHPHLEKLLVHPDVEPFGIRVQGLLLLDGVLDAQFLTVEGEAVDGHR